MVIVRVQSEPFGLEAEVDRLIRARTDLGAIVTFTGLCRDEGGTLAALEIEHYPGMAEEEIGRVVAEALSRWPLEGVTVVHRHGKIAPGEPIVLVVTAGRHRGEAFSAASFLMDYLKTKAPFWKKEVARGAVHGDWVAAKAGDDSAAEKWQGERVSLTLEQQEEAIAACVRQFYAKAREDALLGPIFNATVDDWDVHLRVVADFWSHALLGTDRYPGKPFVVHAHLPIELEHFDRWLALFAETAQATLPTELAAKALAKAHHVAESFKAGIFPFVGADGRPARRPG